MKRMVLRMPWLFCTLMSVVVAGYANEKCLDCHENIAAVNMGTLHGKAGQVCESCHGGSDAHLADPSKANIVVFGRGDAKNQNNQCLTCHGKNQNLMFWDNSKHSQEDVSCTSCHSIHKTAKPVPQQPEKCFECHKNVKAEANKISHHPIIEGRVKCSDCHNPHGTVSPKMIKAETINLLCYNCHADKRGPFIQEHPPVAEDCMICHAPHGTKAAKLNREKMPNLCNNCHGGQHSTGISSKSNSFIPLNTATVNRGIIARSCATCHGNIHGSNAPRVSGQRFIR